MSSGKAVILVLGIIGSLFLVIWEIGGLTLFPSVIKEVSLLLSGKAKLIFKADELKLTLSLVMIVTILALLVTLFFGAFFALVFRGSLRRKNIENLSLGHFLLLAISASLEELYARCLFLGPFFNFLSRFLESSVAFYIAFLLGNTSWSLLHLIEFDSNRKLNYIFVPIPFLVVGILFTYSYLKCGLWGAILSHFLTDLFLLIPLALRNRTFLKINHLLN